MLTVLDSSELLGNAICGGLQRPSVYESLSGSCLGCFRRKQIIFSNLLPDAKLSAISTHFGHWSPLIGFLKARCWRQRKCCMFFGIFQFQVSTHTSTASLAARAAFPVEKKRGNTRRGIRLRHPKKHFCSLKFRETAGFNDPTSWIIHDGGIATWLYQQLTS